MIDVPTATEGEFHYGCLHGQGSISQHGSLLKQGDFVYGRLNGQGVEIHPILGRIEGEFREGQLYGQGTIRFSNGKIAEGEFKGYLLNGRGKIVFPGGKTHEGEFIEGDLIRGRVTAPTGDIYIGQFEACALDKEDSPKSTTGITFVRGRVLFSNGDWFEHDPGQDDSRGNRKKTLPNGDVLKGYIENCQLIAIELINYAKIHQSEAFEISPTTAFAMACQTWTTTREVAEAFLDAGVDPTRDNSLIVSCQHNSNFASFFIERGIPLVSGRIFAPTQKSKGISYYCCCLWRRKKRAY